MQGVCIFKDLNSKGLCRRGLGLMHNIKLNINLFEQKLYRCITN